MRSYEDIKKNGYSAFDNIGGFGARLVSVNADIAVGTQVDIPIFYPGVLDEITLLSAETGSITIDIWRDAFSNYPPLVGDSITGGSPIVMSSANKLKIPSSSLSAWDRSFLANDIYRLNVTSCSGIRNLTIAFKVFKL